MGRTSHRLSIFDMVPEPTNAAQARRVVRNARRDGITNLGITDEINNAFLRLRDAVSTEVIFYTSDSDEKWHAPATVHRVAAERMAEALQGFLRVARHWTAYDAALRMLGPDSGRDHRAGSLMVVKGGNA